MLRRLAPAAAILLLVVPPSSPAGTPAMVSATTFLVSGHGWGHGIGMAQWGAYGYAQHGWGYKKILAHYYRGTTIGQAPISTIRVLVAEKQKQVAIASAAPFKVRDALGTVHSVNALSVAVGPGLKVAVDGQAAPSLLPGPLTFLPGSSALSVGSRAYRGTVEVLVDGKGVDAVDHVGLDSYVRGVTASEMPHTWASEALKAQAVAARSYALAVRRTTGSFDVYGDTRSQVYLGIAGETPESDAAVAATARQVVLYKGKVATTYFFSSSGGETASIQDVWDSPPVPYLTAVPDPYDTLSPYHSWGPVVFTAAGVAKKLKAKGQILDLQTEVNGSQRVGSVSVVTPTGVAQTINGSDFRFDLGLRSSWFSIGALSLARPAPNVAYGSGVTLDGIARGVTATELESKVGAGAWTQVQAVSPGADGAFSVALQPGVTTFYRLTTGTTSGATLRVPVASVVTLSTDGASFTGAVSPALTGGFPVALQQLSGTTWTDVASGTAGADGSYSFPAPATPGEYRVRAVTGHGYVAGLSPTLTTG
jgi:stage II sporulation protein D